MFISSEPQQPHTAQVPWLRTSILIEAQLLHALLTSRLIKFPEGFLFPATDDVRFPKPVPSRTSCAQLGARCRVSSVGTALDYAVWPHRSANALSYLPPTTLFASRVGFRIRIRTRQLFYDEMICFYGDRVLKIMAGKDWWRTQTIKEVF